MTLLTVPPLLSEDLPPCGLMPQIAYINVVQRIRKMWLLHAKKDPANVPLVPICHQVLKNYLDEAERFPLGTANRTRKREPWRRELVFMYEPRWARYFIFETTMIFERESMTEKGREAHDELIADSYPIPPSLRIRVEKDENEEMVWNLWRAWHRKKRSTVPTLNLQGSTGAEEDKAEDGKDGLEERQEVKRQKMSLSVE
jgi:hypothetical protein